MTRTRGTERSRRTSSATRPRTGPEWEMRTEAYLGHGVTRRWEVGVTYRTGEENLDTHCLREKLTSVEDYTTGRVRSLRDIYVIQNLTCHGP